MEFLFPTTLHNTALNKDLASSVSAWCVLWITLSSNHTKFYIHVCKINQVIANLLIKMVDLAVATILYQLHSKS